MRVQSAVEAWLSRATCNFEHTRRELEELVKRVLVVTARTCQYSDFVVYQ